MPLQPYVDQLEPAEDAVIWRYMNMDKFRDLMANEELYFRRADLFKKDDPHEGLPPDEYVRKIRGLRRFDLQDELALNNTQAVNTNSAKATISSVGTCSTARSSKCGRNTHQ